MAVISSGSIQTSAILCALIQLAACQRDNSRPEFFSDEQANRLLSGMSVPVGSFGQNPKDKICIFGPRSLEYKSYHGCEIGRDSGVAIISERGCKMHSVSNLEVALYTEHDFACADATSGAEFFILNRHGTHHLILEYPGDSLNGKP